MSQQPNAQILDGLNRLTKELDEKKDNNLIPEDAMSMVGQSQELRTGENLFSA